MAWKIFPRRTTLNFISAIIMVIGLVSAAFIYHNSVVNLPYGDSGYETANGAILAIMPQDSKMYRHNLEVYGGKLNVMMDDFRRWFVGLWQGKSLAFIIACITIIIAFGFFYAANYLPQPLESDVPNENYPDATG
jgi:ABC-type phosphate/phosphonate transport system permease subunit